MFSKQRIKLFFFVLISANLFAGCSLARPTSDDSTQSSSIDFSAIEDRQLIPVQIGSNQLTVEVVNTSASLTQGLGGRDRIGSDGMLFSLPQRQIAEFWMMGMSFPLDFVWIDGDQIVGMLENAPAPSNQDIVNLPTYSSKEPVTLVLELDAGRVAKLQLAVGDRLTIGTQN